MRNEVKENLNGLEIGLDQLLENTKSQLCILLSDFEIETVDFSSISKTLFLTGILTQDEIKNFIYLLKNFKDLSDNEMEKLLDIYLHISDSYTVSIIFDFYERCLNVSRNLDYKLIQDNDPQMSNSRFEKVFDISSRDVLILLGSIDSVSDVYKKIFIDTAFTFPLLLDESKILLIKDCLHQIFNSDFFKILLFLRKYKLDNSIKN